MTFTSIQLISIAVLFAALLICLIVIIARCHSNIANLSSELKAFKRAFFDEQQSQNALLNRIEETEASIYSMHKKIDPLPNKISQLEGGLREQLAQDPQLKLYQKAAAMAKQGASSQEIAQECDLPVAEASVLVSLHK